MQARGGFTGSRVHHRSAVQPRIRTAYNGFPTDCCGWQRNTNEFTSASCREASRLSRPGSGLLPISTDRWRMPRGFRATEATPKSTKSPKPTRRAGTPLMCRCCTMTFVCVAHTTPPKLGSLAAEAALWWIKSIGQAMLNPHSELMRRPPQTCGSVGLVIMHLHRPAHLWHPAKKGS